MERLQCGVFHLIYVSSIETAYVTLGLQGSMSSVAQAAKVGQRDEVGFDVYHRLLWGNRIIYCSVIEWFSFVATSVYAKN